MQLYKIIFSFQDVMDYCNHKLSVCSSYVLPEKPSWKRRKTGWKNILFTHKILVIYGKDIDSTHMELGFIQVIILHLPIQNDKFT